MAVEETRVLPAPALEGAMTAFTKMLPPLMGKPIDTSVYAPKVADRNKLQEEAYNAAMGLGSLVGPDAYKPFMSPYQQEVMDTTLAEFDRQQAIQQTGLRDQAIAAGAYGGGREGVMAAQFANQGAMNRAQLQANLLNQGFQQAQMAAANDLAARQGLGNYMSALGADRLGYDTAKLDAGVMAAREAEFEPFTRLGLIGNMISSLNPGSFPTTTVGYQPSAAPASPMSSFLGGAAGAGGVLGKLGIFG